MITKDLELLEIGHDLLNMVLHKVRYERDCHTVELYESLTEPAEKIIAVANELLRLNAEETAIAIHDKPIFYRNERVSDKCYYEFNPEKGIYELVKPTEGGNGVG